MRYSDINWNNHNLSPLVQATGLNHDDVFALMDQYGGIHTKNGHCSKSKSDLIDRMTSNICTAAEFNEYKLGEEDENSDRYNYLLIKPLVKDIIDELDLIWESKDIMDLL